MASGYRGSVLDCVRRLYGSGTIAALSEAQLLERFVGRGDASAFEAILVRHGPMVLGVCRRVLDDPHDVDDAFQATFLILIKKAGSIRDRDVLGTWLYGVARRVAVRARVNSRRRSTRERSGIETAELAATAGDHSDVDELRALIDAELERLPERYRAPVILCDLEGQTHEQAATQLRCPVGTVKSRLSRGREQLRAHLSRRGVSPSAGLISSALSAGTSLAGPLDRMDPTIHAAAKFAAAPADPAGTCSADVATLAKGVLTSMALSKLKVAAAAVLILGLTVAASQTRIRKLPANELPKRASPALDGQAPAIALAAGPGVAQPAEPHVVRFELQNGLKAILRPIQGTQQTAIVVLYAIGQDHDPEGQSGLGHMVEHVYVTAAAGGAKARTSDEFFRLYPDGANGQTGDRYTVIATVFPANKLDSELADAAARMGDLRVTADDLARETPRMLMEVDNMFSGFPALAAQNQARELVRPTPREGRRGGLPQVIRSLKPEAVQSHWKRYYKPRNAILAMAGAIDPAAARKAIATHFAKLPAGDAVPTPGNPDRPKFETIKELTAESRMPGGRPTACLAYSAPQPDSDVYAPFLVLIARLWAGADRLGGEPMSFPVYFTPLDDGAIVGISAPAKPGESPKTALARLDRFVADTVGPKLGEREADSTREQFGFLLGLEDVADEALAQNPYGVAFSLARRTQLAIAASRLRQAIDAVTENDLRRAAEEVFAPKRHAAAFIAVE